MSPISWKNCLLSSPWYIGHRGAPSYTVENTANSFLFAIQRGLPAIELDVWLVDGMPIVFHDDSLERMFGKAVKISDLTASDLEYERYSDGSKITNLNEILEIAKEKCCINIELKGPSTAHITYECLEQALDNGWKKDQFLISSFQHDELYRFKDLDCTYQLGLLLKNRNDDMHELVRTLNPFSIHVKDEEIDELALQALLDFGRPVFAYTVNSAERADWLFDQGIRGVFTDDPEIMTSGKK